MKKNLATIIVLLGILIFAGLYTVVIQNKGNSNSVASEAKKALSNEETSPYTDLDGNTIELDAYDGQVRIVNSWASWCPFCVRELPDLNTIADEYGDRNVVVLAINRKESAVQSRNFISSVGFLKNIIFVQDATDTFYKSIGGLSMPETVFYDTDGNISTHKRGFMTLDEMRIFTDKAIRVIE